MAKESKVPLHLTSVTTETCISTRTAKITLFCSCYVTINTVEFPLGQPIYSELSYKLRY